MNRPLTRRECLVHLEAIITGIAADPGKDLVFLDRLKKLRVVVDTSDRNEISLDAVHKALFDGLKSESRRTTFSAFRSALASSAAKFGRSFALVQPHGRGKSASQIPLHFEGSPISMQPAIDAATNRAVAGLDRQNLIEAPAAFLTGEFLNRLLGHFTNSETAARLPVRFFLSHAHKNLKLKDKLVDALSDELAISNRFAFTIWQDKGITVGNEWHRDIQNALDECDLCISLLSPAFLASKYIAEHEIPPLISGEIPSIPVLLEPLDLGRQNLRGLEKLQFFTLNENSHPRAFSECSGEVARRFVRLLAAEIESKVSTVAEEVARHFAIDYLSGKPDALAHADCHPDLREILQNQSSSLPVKQSQEETIPFPDTAKHRLNALLPSCLKSLPENLIAAYAATGDLESVTREIARKSSEGDGQDPYAILRTHQRTAADFLAAWVMNPKSPPFAAVLGEIGSGKTTTLQMLARRIADDPMAPPVIFIDLREYFDTERPTLEGILAEHLRRNDLNESLNVEELIEAVRNQKALIIFDGLDEKIIALTDAARQNFIRELWRILPTDIMDKPASSGRGRIIISCRSHYFPTIQALGSGYTAQDRGKVTARDYLACVMLPWQDKQVREYLRRLLGDDKLESALELIGTVHNLRDLSTRPYLLQLIGPELEDLEKDRAAGLAVNAASLYRKFVERWLNRDEGKHVFTPAHKLRLMERLAADLWRNNARTWPWDRVEEWLEFFLHENPVIASALNNPPISILQQDFRTATFFLRPDASSDTFRFAHTSLQEYFLACHLARGLELSDTSAWDLPEPSLETLKFLGQHLLTLTSEARKKIITGLECILSSETLTSNCRRNALHYHLIATDRAYPSSEAPTLNCTNLNLSDWKFCGSPNRKIKFGAAIFRNTKLQRTSFEYVDFQSTIDFSNADLRYSKFASCSLEGADFRGASMTGLFLRQCELYGICLDDSSASAAILDHLCTNSPWLSSSQPIRPCALLNTKHPFPARSLSLSTDCKQFLSTSDGNSFEVWDHFSGTCLRSFFGHSNTVTSASFSPNSSQIASGSSDNTVKLWSTIHGDCILTLAGHEDAVTCVGFSNNSDLIVSGSCDKSIKLWSPSTGKCIRTFEGHERTVTSVALSPDSKLLLSGSYDSTVKIWDTNSGICIKTFTGHHAPVNSVAWSSDASFVASGSSDKTLKIWKVDSEKCIKTLSGHKDRIIQIVLFEQSGKIASCSFDGTIRIWNSTSGRCIRVLSACEKPISSIAISKNCKEIISVSPESSVDLWDIDSGECIESISKGVASRARILASSSNTKHILVESFESSIELWDIESGRRKWFVRKFPTRISVATFSPDQRQVAAIGTDGRMYCWDLVGNAVRASSEHRKWFRIDSGTSRGGHVELAGRTIFRLSEGNRILREVFPLQNGEAIVREPWDENETTKPHHEIRWRFIRGPEDAWRWCQAVDLETGAIHPPELAAVPGAFSGPEAGPS